jgi:hypothetical protein
MAGISLDELLLDNESAIKIQDSNGDELGINADGSIDVNILGGVNVEVDLDHTDDSVRLGDGTNLTTVTQNGADFGLDVNIINDDLTVTATDLDIRDLAFATDSVDVTGSEVSLDAATLAALETITVVATDLDIRDLSASQDNVAISDGTNTLVVEPDGSINVNADLSSAIADDEADAGNPIKIGGRAVSGALAAVSASNDRYDLLGDLYRRTWVNTSRNIAMLNSQDDVTTTAAQVLTSPLAGRREVTIQNEGSQAVYVGSSAAVTSSNGIKISKNSSATFEFGEDINIFMIADSGTQDVRFLESA